MKPPRKRAFSARKAAKSRISPHRNRKDEVVSPQTDTDTKNTQDSEILRTRVGHAENYASAFHCAGAPFWAGVESLRQTQSGSIKERVEQGRKVLKLVPWLTNRANYLFTDDFVLRFVEAVRDNTLPKKTEPRARFLGDSLGTDGTTSARRSRDIVGRERAKQKRQANKPAAEFYIFCCGKARWTVNCECPKCGRNPLPLQLPF